MHPQATPAQPRRRFHRAAPTFAVVLGLGVLLWLILGFAGTALVIDEPPQHAHAIVVLAGHTPFRAMEGAALYEQGWAPQVWLTQARVSSEDKALMRLGIERTSDAQYSQQVLVRLGVPENRVVMLPGENFNTADEVRLVAQRLRAEGASRAIVVTSPAHTRRVRTLWDGVVGDSPEIVVRYTPMEEFDRRGWWRQSADVQKVAREWAGLLNAWLGFPIRTDR